MSFRPTEEQELQQSQELSLHLKIAIDKLLVSGKLKENPLVDSVAAVSVGLRRR